MEVRRIFVDKLKMKNGLALLAGPPHKYVTQVLRKGVGDRIDLLDGKGYLYRCTINGVRSKELLLQVVDVIHNPEEKRPRVTLCISPIKGPRMDWLVEKVTELGVDRIVPTLFKRTIIKIDEKERSKTERWKRIAIEASRQCGRFTIPEFGEPTPLRGILPFVETSTHRWVLYEREKDVPASNLIGSYREGEISIVIGPEGGIEESEISWLEERGFVACTLGETIFRTETTPLVVLSIIHYECNKR
jgi:16S rRNA (uracil1498-N3)-methyltransferase